MTVFCYGVVMIFVAVLYVYIVASAAIVYRDISKNLADPAEEGWLCYNSK